MAGYTLLVGPDGSGKTTVIDNIALRATPASVGMSAPHPGPDVATGSPARLNVTTRTHERTERGLLVSIGKLVLLAADALLGYFFVWRKVRCRGLLLAERVWCDGKASNARKTGIGAGELARYLIGWGRSAPHASRQLQCFGDSAWIGVPSAIERTVP